VAVQGVRNREIDVVVRKETRALWHFSSQVVGAIGSSNASLPSVHHGKRHFLQHCVSGGLDSVKDIGSIAISQHRRAMIYLRDIADVSDGVEKATSYSRISSAGQPSQQALTLAISKSTDRTSPQPLKPYVRSLMN